MLKIERKLLEWVEKHMYVLVLAFISLLALYLRRIPIWWNPGNVTAYFDCHVNCTQSFLYYLLVQAVQYLPLLPVHSIKWISVIGDFGTAALCLLLVRENRKDNALLPVFCYTMCLFSPVLILRGCVWAQIDSVAIMLFLLGWLFWKKEKKTLAAVSVLLSALLYPCMIIFVFLLLLGEKLREKAVAGGRDSSSRLLEPNQQDKKYGRKTKCEWLKVLGFFAVWLLGCGLAALLLGKGFGEGLKNGFNWLRFDPVSGQGFVTVLDWMVEMLINLGLAGSVIGGLMLVRRRGFPLFFMLGVHFLIAVLYGGRLFGGWL